MLLYYCQVRYLVWFLGLFGFCLVFCVFFFVVVEKEAVHRKSILSWNGSIQLGSRSLRFSFLNWRSFPFAKICLILLTATTCCGFWLSFKYWCGSITVYDLLILLKLCFYWKAFYFASCILVIYGYGYLEVLFLLKILQNPYKARCLLKNSNYLHRGIIRFSVINAN